MPLIREAGIDRIMRLILFDADGTIIDSQAIIFETMRLCFARFSLPEPDLADVRSIIGLTLDRAIATLLDSAIDPEIDAMAGEYRDMYLELVNREDMECRPYPGMANLIRQLSARDDVLLGIVTGKSSRGLRRMVEINEFDGCFVTSRCADDCPSKPDPAMVNECVSETGALPCHTVVIGDTSFDMEMANSAGVGALGVTWGYHPSNMLSAAGAHRLVSDAHDLAAALEQWLASSHLVPHTAYAAQEFQNG